MVNVVNLLAGPVGAPDGLWATILNWIEGSIVNYGWVIILFTLLIKACLIPLDFLMKFSTKKQTLVQQKLAPQIARINQKYQNDKNQAQLQTNALYKKEGFNVFASCIVMIINLAITMTVFLTLFNSLREISAFKAINQYDALQTAYVQTYNDNIGTAKTEFIDKFGTGKIAILYEDDGTGNYTEISYTTVNFDNITLYFYAIDPTSVVFVEGDEVANAEAKTATEKALTYFVDSEKTKTVSDLLVECGTHVNELATEAASKKWNDVKDNWLWIENIWVADSYKSPLPTYDDLKEMAKSSKIKEYKTYVSDINEDLYIQVTSSIHAKVDRWNGYFILAILAGATSFLSQFLSELMSKPKDKNVNKLVESANANNGSMKIMKILLPAMMVVFVLTSSSAFGIYIVASSLISMGISALVGVIVNSCYKKKQEEVMEYLEKEALKVAKRSKRRM
ncbi:MAG: membrane protein insertase YidC [Clostridia bacterium]|nr:membrane protein insertase YidC [Clostridia bacterium]